MLSESTSDKALPQEQVSGIVPTGQEKQKSDTAVPVAGTMQQAQVKIVSSSGVEAAQTAGGPLLFRSLDESVLLETLSRFVGKTAKGSIAEDEEKSSEHVLRVPEKSEEALKTEGLLQKALESYTRMLNDYEKARQAYLNLLQIKRGAKGFLDVKKSVLDLNTVLELEWQYKLLEKNEAYRVSEGVFMNEGLAEQKKESEEDRDALQYMIDHYKFANIGKYIPSRQQVETGLNYWQQHINQAETELTSLNKQKSSTGLTADELKLLDLQVTAQESRKVIAQKEINDLLMDRKVHYDNIKETAMSIATRKRDLSIEEISYYDATLALYKQIWEIQKNSNTSGMSKLKTWLEQLNSRDNNVMERLRERLGEVSDATENMLRAQGVMFSQDNLLDEAKARIEELIMQLNKQGAGEQLVLTLSDNSKLVSKQSFSRFIDGILEKSEYSVEQRGQLKDKALGLDASTLEKLGLTDLNFTRMGADENSYYFVTHAGYGEWEEVYVKAGNLLKLFGNTQMNVFAYGLGRNSSDGLSEGAYGMGAEFVTTGKERPLSNALVFDIYKPIFPEAIAWKDTGEGDGPHSRLFVFEDFGVLLAKDESGDYRAFIGFEGFADVPLFSPEKGESTEKGGLNKENYEFSGSSFGGLLKANYRFFGPIKLKAEAGAFYAQDNRSQDFSWKFGDPITGDSWQFVDPETGQITDTFKYSTAGKQMKYIFERLGVEIDMQQVLKSEDSFSVEFFVEDENNTEGYDQSSVGAGVKKNFKMKVADVRLKGEAKFGEEQNIYKGEVGVKLPKDWDIRLQARYANHPTWSASVGKKVGGVNLEAGIAQPYESTGKIYPYITADKSANVGSALDDALDEGEAKRIFSGQDSRIESLKGSSPLVSSLPYALSNSSYSSTVAGIREKLSRDFGRFSAFMKGRVGMSIDNGEVNSSIEKKYGFDIGVSFGVERKDQLTEAEIGTALVDIQRDLRELDVFYAQRCNEIVDAYITLVKVSWRKEASLQMLDKVKGSASDELVATARYEFEKARTEYQTQQARFAQLINNGQKATEIITMLPKMGDTKLLHEQVKEAVGKWFSGMEPIKLQAEVEEVGFWKGLFSGKIARTFRNLGLKKVEIGWDITSIALGDGPSAKLNVPIRIYDPENSAKSEVLDFEHQIFDAQSREFIKQAQAENFIAAEQRSKRAQLAEEIDSRRVLVETRLLQAVSDYNNIESAKEGDLWQSADQKRSDVELQASLLLDNERDLAFLLVNEEVLKLRERAQLKTSRSPPKDKETPVVTQEASVPVIEELNSNNFLEIFTNNVTPNANISVDIAQMRLNQARILSQKGNPAGKLSVDIGVGFDLESGDFGVFPSLRGEIGRGRDTKADKFTAEQEQKEIQRNLVVANLKELFITSLTKYIAFNEMLEEQLDTATRAEIELELIRVRAVINQILNQPLETKLNVNLTLEDIEQKIAGFFDKEKDKADENARLEMMRKQLIILEAQKKIIESGGNLKFDLPVYLFFSPEPTVIAAWAGIKLLRWFIGYLDNSKHLEKAQLLAQMQSDIDRLRGQTQVQEAAASFKTETVKLVISDEALKSADFAKYLQATVQAVRRGIDVTDQSQLPDAQTAKEYAVDAADILEMAASRDIDSITAYLNFKFAREDSSFRVKRYLDQPQSYLEAGRWFGDSKPAATAVIELTSEYEKMPWLDDYKRLQLERDNKELLWQQAQAKAELKAAGLLYELAVIELTQKNVRDERALSALRVRKAEVEKQLKVILGIRLDNNLTVLNLGKLLEGRKNFTVDHAQAAQLFTTRILNNPQITGISNEVQQAKVMIQGLMQEFNVKARTVLGFKSGKDSQGQQVNDIVGGIYFETPDAGQIADMIRPYVVRYKIKEEEKEAAVAGLSLELNTLFADLSGYGQRLDSSSKLFYTYLQDYEAKSYLGDIEEKVASEKKMIEAMHSYLDDLYGFYSSYEKLKTFLKSVGVDISSAQLKAQSGKVVLPAAQLSKGTALANTQDVLWERTWRDILSITPDDARPVMENLQSAMKDWNINYNDLSARLMVEDVTEQQVREFAVKNQLLAVYGRALAIVRNERLPERLRVKVAEAVGIEELFTYQVLRDKRLPEEKIVDIFVDKLLKHIVDKHIMFLKANNKARDVLGNAGFYKEFMERIYSLQYRLEQKSAYERNGLDKNEIKYLVSQQISKWQHKYEPVMGEINRPADALILPKGSLDAKPQYFTDHQKWLFGNMERQMLNRFENNEFDVVLLRMEPGQKEVSYEGFATVEEFELAYPPKQAHKYYDFALPGEEVDKWGRPLRQLSDEEISQRDKQGRRYQAWITKDGNEYMVLFSPGLLEEKAEEKASFMKSEKKLSGVLARIEHAVEMRVDKYGNPSGEPVAEYSDKRIIALEKNNIPVLDDKGIPVVVLGEKNEKGDLLEESRRIGFYAENADGILIRVDPGKYAFDHIIVEDTIRDNNPKTGNRIMFGEGSIRRRIALNVLGRDFAERRVKQDEQKFQDGQKWKAVEKMLPMFGSLAGEQAVGVVRLLFNIGVTMQSLPDVPTKEDTKKLFEDTFDGDAEKFIKFVQKVNEGDKNKTLDERITEATGVKKQKSLDILKLSLYVIDNAAGIADIKRDNNGLLKDWFAYFSGGEINLMAILGKAFGQDFLGRGEFGAQGAQRLLVPLGVTVDIFDLFKIDSKSDVYNPDLFRVYIFGYPLFGDEQALKQYIDARKNSYAVEISPDKNGIAKVYPSKESMEKVRLKRVGSVDFKLLGVNWDLFVNEETGGYIVLGARAFEKEFEQLQRELKRQQDIEKIKTGEPGVISRYNHESAPVIDEQIFTQENIGINDIVNFVVGSRSLNTSLPPSYFYEPGDNGLEHNRNISYVYDLGLSYLLLESQGENVLGSAQADYLANTRTLYPYSQELKKGKGELLGIANAIDSTARQGRILEDYTTTGPVAYVARMFLTEYQKTKDQRFFDRAVELMDVLENRTSDDGAVVKGVKRDVVRPGEEDHWQIKSGEENIDVLSLYRQAHELYEKDPKKYRQLKSVNARFEKIADWLCATLYDRGKGYFIRGTLRNEKDNVFATDVNVLMLLGLGPKELDSRIGDGTAERIWRNTQAQAKVNVEAQKSDDTKVNVSLYDWTNAEERAKADRNEAGFLEISGQMALGHLVMAEYYQQKQDMDSASDEISKYKALISALDSLAVSVLGRGAVYPYSTASGIKAFSDSNFMVPQARGSTSATSWIGFAKLGFNPLTNEYIAPDLSGIPQSQRAGKYTSLEKGWDENLSAIIRKRMQDENTTVEVGAEYKDKAEETLESLMARKEKLRELRAKAASVGLNNLNAQEQKELQQLVNQNYLVYVDIKRFRYGYYDVSSKQPVEVTINASHEDIEKDIERLSKEKAFADKRAKLMEQGGITVYDSQGRIVEMKIGRDEFEKQLRQVLSLSPAVANEIAQSGWAYPSYDAQGNQILIVIQHPVGESIKLENIKNPFSSEMENLTFERGNLIKREVKDSSTGNVREVTISEFNELGIKVRGYSTNMITGEKVKEYAGLSYDPKTGEYAEKEIDLINHSESIKVYSGYKLGYPNPKRVITEDMVLEFMMDADGRAVQNKSWKNIGTLENPKVGEQEESSRAKRVSFNKDTGWSEWLVEDFEHDKAFIETRDNLGRLRYEYSGHLIKGNFVKEKVTVYHYAYDENKFKGLGFTAQEMAVLASYGKSMVGYTYEYDQAKEGGLGKLLSKSLMKKIDGKNYIDEKGKVLVEFEDMLKPKVWQEVRNNKGYRVLRYDGYLENGNFIFERITEFIYANALLAKTGTATKAVCYYYDGKTKGNVVSVSELAAVDKAAKQMTLRVTKDKTQYLEIYSMSGDKLYTVNPKVGKIFKIAHDKYDYEIGADVYEIAQKETGKTLKIKTGDNSWQAFQISPLNKQRISRQWALPDDLPNAKAIGPLDIVKTHVWTDSDDLKVIQAKPQVSDVPVFAVDRYGDEVAKFYRNEAVFNLREKFADIKNLKGISANVTGVSNDNKISRVYAFDETTFQIKKKQSNAEYDLKAWAVTTDKEVDIDKALMEWMVIDRRSADMLRIERTTAIDYYGTEKAVITRLPEGQRLIELIKPEDKFVPQEARKKIGTDDDPVRIMFLTEFSDKAKTYTTDTTGWFKVSFELNPEQFIGVIGKVKNSDSSVNEIKRMLETVAKDLNIDIPNNNVFEILVTPTVSFEKSGGETKAYRFKGDPLAREVIAGLDNAYIVAVSFDEEGKSTKSYTVFSGNIIGEAITPEEKKTAKEIITPIIEKAYERTFREKKFAYLEDGKGRFDIWTYLARLGITPETKLPTITLTKFLPIIDEDTGEITYEPTNKGTQKQITLCLLPKDPLGRELISMFEMADPDKPKIIREAIVFNEWWRTDLKNPLGILPGARIIFKNGKLGEDKEFRDKSETKAYTNGKEGEVRSAYNYKVNRSVYVLHEYFDIKTNRLIQRGFTQVVHRLGNLVPIRDGSENVFYDIHFPYEKPVKGYHESGELVRYWEKFGYRRDGIGVQQVIERNPLTTAVSRERYEYSKVGGFLNKKRADIFDEIDRTMAEQISLWEAQRGADMGMGKRKEIEERINKSKESPRLLLEKLKDSPTYNPLSKELWKYLHENIEIKEMVAVFAVAVVWGLPYLIKGIAYLYRFISGLLRKTEYAKKIAKIKEQEELKDKKDQEKLTDEIRIYAKEYDFDDPAKKKEGKDDTTESIVFVVSNQLVGSNRTQEKLLADAFSEFRDWLSQTEQSLPAGIELDLKHYVLYKLIDMRAGNFKKTLPAIRFYLFLRALRMEAENEKRKQTGEAMIAIGKEISAEIDIWLKNSHGFYIYKNLGTGYSSDSTPKKYRINYEDMEEMFRDKEFVSRLLNERTMLRNGAEFNDALRKALQEGVQKLKDVLASAEKTQKLAKKLQAMALDPKKKIEGAEQKHGDLDVKLVAEIMKIFAKSFLKSLGEDWLKGHHKARKKIMEQEVMWELQQLTEVFLKYENAKRAVEKTSLELEAAKKENESAKLAVAEKKKKEADSVFEKAKEKKESAVKVCVKRIKNITNIDVDENKLGQIVNAALTAMSLAIDFLGPRSSDKERKPYLEVFYPLVLGKEGSLEAAISFLNAKASDLEKKAGEISENAQQTNNQIQALELKAEQMREPKQIETEIKEAVSRIESASQEEAKQAAELFTDSFISSFDIYTLKTDKEAKKEMLKVLQQAVDAVIKGDAGLKIAALDSLVSYFRTTANIDVEPGYIETKIKASLTTVMILPAMDIKNKDVMQALQALLIVAEVYIMNNSGKKAVARPFAEVLAQWLALSVLMYSTQEKFDKEGENYEEQREFQEIAEKIQFYKTEKDISGDITLGTFNIGKFSVKGTTLLGLTLGLIAAAMASLFGFGSYETTLTEKLIAPSLITLAGLFTGTFASRVGLKGWFSFFGTFAKQLSIYLGLALIVAVAVVPSATAFVTQYPVILGASAIMLVGALIFGYPVRKIFVQGSVEKGKRGAFFAKFAGQSALSVVFWGLTFGTKLIWNVLLVNWLKIPFLNILALNIPGLYIGLFLIILVAPFVIFFFLDSFTFFYFWEWVFGLFKGWASGLGPQESAKTIREGLKNSAQNAQTLVIGSHEQEPESLKKNGNLISAAVLENLIRESMISEQEKEQMLEDASKLPSGLEARERLQFFFGSLNMIKHRVSSWELLPSLSLCIPAATTESIFVFLEELNKPDKGINKTKLTHQIAQYPVEWHNLILKIQKQFPQIPLEKLKEWENLAQKQAFNFEGIVLDGAAKRKITEMVEDWANMRFQPVYRTIMGLVSVWRAYQLHAKMYFNTEDEDFINKKVAEKLQLLAGVQRYGKKDEESVRIRKFVMDLMEKLYVEEGITLEITYSASGVTGVEYVEGERDEKGKRVVTSIKERNAPSTTDSHKSFKPIIQNSILGWVRNDVSFFFDSNCSFRFEDALKLPLLLQEFNDDPTLMGVNIPEYIYTTRFNWLGEAHGFGDRTWTAFIQRVISQFGAVGFYGHGALFRTELMAEFGTIAPDYVSEDLMLAIKTWLKGKGYHIAHREYVQAGKAREVSIVSGAVPFQKFAAGSAEMAMGRQLRNLFKSKEFTWGQKLMLFFTLAFFYRKPLVLIGLPLYLISVLFFGISGYAAFPLEISLAVLGVWFSQMISFTGIGQWMIERGINKAIVDFFGLLPTAFIVSMIAKTLFIPMSLLPAFGMTALIVLSVIFWKKARSGNLEKAIPSFFGILPKLIAVFIAYVPVYAVGVTNGMKGLARFVTTAKGWGIEKFDFINTVFKVGIWNDKKGNLDFPQANESFRFQMVFSSVFVLIAALGAYLWQAVPIWWSALYLTSIFMWMYSVIISLPGILLQTTHYGISKKENKKEKAEQKKLTEEPAKEKAKPKLSLKEKTKLLIEKFFKTEFGAWTVLLWKEYFWKIWTGPGKDDKEYVNFKEHHGKWFMTKYFLFFDLSLVIAGAGLLGFGGASWNIIFFLGLPSVIGVFFVLYILGGLSFLLRPFLERLNLERLDKINSAPVRGNADTAEPAVTSSEQPYPAVVSAEVRRLGLDELKAKVKINITKTGINVIGLEGLGLDDDEFKILNTALGNALEHISAAEQLEQMSLDLPILVSYDLKEISRHLNARIELHRHLLRKPDNAAEQLLYAPKETQEETILFLTGVLFHEIIHFLNPEIPESDVEARTVEYYKQNPEILRAALKILDENNINLISADEAWLSLLRKTYRQMISQQALAEDKVKENISEVQGMLGSVIADEEILSLVNVQDIVLNIAPLRTQDLVDKDDIISAVVDEVSMFELKLIGVDIADDGSIFIKGYVDEQALVQINRALNKFGLSFNNPNIINIKIAALNKEARSLNREQQIEFELIMARINNAELGIIDVDTKVVFEALLEVIRERRPVQLPLDDKAVTPLSTDPLNAIIDKIVPVIERQQSPQDMRELFDIAA
ncbi:MAG: hypothetical protein HY810_06800 [Candidatus Omnitrophica bacterium]|nr:hypothetical protein [Candidatus Omnitrophota bacterium]